MAVPDLLFCHFDPVPGLVKNRGKSLMSGCPLDCPHITFINTGTALDTQGLVNTGEPIPQGDCGHRAEDNTGTAGYTFFFKYSDCHNTQPIVERNISFIMGNI